MKIHRFSTERFNDCPDLFPDEFLNEEMAARNHGQSLAQLNERGGLAISEILANILQQDSRWIQMHPEEQWQVDMINSIIKHAR